VRPHADQRLPSVTAIWVSLVPEIGGKHDTQIADGHNSSFDEVN
jgi:hypothetical protein